MSLAPSLLAAALLAAIWSGVAEAQSTVVRCADGTAVAQSARAPDGCPVSYDRDADLVAEPATICREANIYVAGNRGTAGDRFHVRHIRSIARTCDATSGGAR